MIENVGIGIDIVETNRFKKISYKTNKNFYKKIFQTSEIEYCLKFKEPYKHFAAKFAIKEALIKSISSKISLLDIKTDHSNSKPTVTILGNRKYCFQTSLSHENNFVVAIVISEKL